MHQQNQRKGLLFILAAVITGAVFLTGTGIYMLLKTTEKPVASSESSSLTSTASSVAVPVPDKENCPRDYSSEDEKQPFALILLVHFAASVVKLV